jgi:peptidoglycan/xylan/chitin deacetylase (PgdA/CDA1 family)
MLRSRARSELLRRVSSRVVVVRGAPVFSFTFDDIPASAAGTGARLLEDAGARGTFYVAPGIAGTTEAGSPGDPRATLEEVAGLHARGHEIGCHSFSHRRRAAWESPEDLAADCARAREVLSGVTGRAIEHFSYPYGEHSLSTKRLLGDDYATLRLTEGGLNLGRTDVRMLRAESLYSQGLDRASLSRVIDRCAAEGGWLVFYTHGVVPRPNPVGISPDDLAWVIERCRGRGDILTVGNALARYA